ncbi:hypothetical protein [Piscinibacter sakaiensis]|uniref:hypothetical protein n=1 Tax=Piscinibacter sakaiensis TaxID=1547922 RepID=UPI003AB03709
MDQPVVAPPAVTGEARFDAFIFAIVPFKAKTSKRQARKPSVPALALPLTLER